MKTTPQIFLSYVRTNKDCVEDLYKRLSSEGFQPWMDREDVDDPKKAVELIIEHRIPGKPLIVEGIENRNYLRFLDRHWPFESHGSLFGQGYIVLPGKPWDEWTLDLRDFGLPGGHFMNNPSSN